MKAIVLTYAPINKIEAKLLRETNIFKIACNNYCADLKPDIRLCADDIVDKCLECDTCDVVSCNYDLHKDRVINGAYLPKRHSSLLHCIDYLYLKGFDQILLVASNPESATHKINNDGINEMKEYLYLYKYSQEGLMDIPQKTIKEFIMLTDDERILGIEENRERKMFSKLLFTHAYRFEVETKGYNNKSNESGFVVGSILPMEYKNKLLAGEKEVVYNDLIVRRIMPEVKEVKIEEEIEEKPIVKKKPVRKVSKKK